MNVWRSLVRPRPRSATLLAVLVVAVASSGCATKRDFRDLRTELRAQAVRQDSLYLAIGRQLNAIGDSLSLQADQDFEFRGEMARELLDIQDQLIQVQEMSGVNQRTLSQLRDQVAEDRSRLDAAPRRGGGTADASGADEAFQAALDAYERRSNTAARLGFQQFVQQYPTHERTVEAYYYLGDVLQQEEDVEGAISAFLRIPEFFPADPLAADALVRVGVIELERDQPEVARTYFQRVITGYADSAAAQVARERLSEIGILDGGH